MKKIRKTALDYYKENPDSHGFECQEGVEDAFVSGAFWMFRAAVECAAGETKVTMLDDDDTHQNPEEFLAGFKMGMAVVCRHLALQIDEDHVSLITPPDA